MPKLMNGTTKNQFFFDENNFKITANIDCDIIEENKNIYKTILFPPMSSFKALPLNTAFLYELNINVKDTNCPGYPHLKMDESCKLLLKFMKLIKFKKKKFK